MEKAIEEEGEMEEAIEGGEQNKCWPVQDKEGGKEGGVEGAHSR